MIATGKSTPQRVALCERGGTMKFDKQKLQSFLCTIYDLTVSGSLPTSDSARQLAAKYMKMPGSLEQRIDKLIRSQISWGVCSGFLSGFGGLAAMLFVLPLNIVSVMFIEVRLIAAIAIMCGCDPDDRRVKTLVTACLIGEGAVDLVKSVTLNTIRLSAGKIIDTLNKQALRRIEEKAVQRVFERFSKALAPKIIRAVPLAGGIFGGAIDGLAVVASGKAAKKVFLDDYVRRYMETQTLSSNDIGEVRINF